MSGALEVWWRKFAKSYQLKAIDTLSQVRNPFTIKLASISQRKLGVKRVIVHYPEKWSCEKELTWDEAKALALAVIRLNGKQIILKGQK